MQQQLITAAADPTPVVHWSCWSNSSYLLQVLIQLFTAAADPTAANYYSCWSHTSCTLKLLIQQQVHCTCWSHTSCSLQLLIQQQLYTSAADPTAVVHFSCWSNSSCTLQLLIQQPISAYDDPTAYSQQLLIQQRIHSSCRFNGSLHNRSRSYILQLFSASDGATEPTTSAEGDGGPSVLSVILVCYFSSFEQESLESTLCWSVQ